MLGYCFDGRIGFKQSGKILLLGPTNFEHRLFWSLLFVSRVKLAPNAEDSPIKIAIIRRLVFEGIV